LRIPSCLVIFGLYLVLASWGRCREKEEWEDERGREREQERERERDRDRGRSAAGGCGSGSHRRASPPVRTGLYTYLHALRHPINISQSTETR
jgi:hypothetical protein